MQDFLENEKVRHILSKMIIIGVLFFFLWTPALALQNTVFFDQNEYPYLSVFIMVPFFCWGVILLFWRLWIPGIALLCCCMSQINNQSYLHRYAESTSDVLAISLICAAITILSAFFVTRKYQNTISKLWLCGFAAFMVFFSIFLTVFFPPYNDISSKEWSWFIIRYLALFASISPLLFVAVIASHIYKTVKSHTYIFYALSSLLILESVPANYGEDLMASFVYLTGYIFIGFCVLIQFVNVMTNQFYLKEGDDFGSSNIRDIISKSLEILLTPQARRIILTLFITGLIFAVASYFIILTIL